MIAIKFKHIGTVDGVRFAEVTITTKTLWQKSIETHRIAKPYLSWVLVDSGEFAPADWGVDALARRHELQAQYSRLPVKRDYL